MRNSLIKNSLLFLLTLLSDYALPNNSGNETLYFNKTHENSIVTINSDFIFMQNDFVERAFQIKEGFSTRSFVSRIAKKEYSSNKSKEFTIDINGKTYDGKSFNFEDAKISSIPGGKQLNVKLKGKKDIEGFEIELIYWIYDDSPAIRKQLKLKSNNNKEVVLTNLNIESLVLVPADIYMTNAYTNYGTNITRTPYIGGYNDPAVLLYNEIYQEGIILVNEAPGILKRTDCYSKDYEIGIGMNRGNENYPFRKYLIAGEVFESPKTTILFSKRDKWQDCFELDLADFVRTNMGIKLFMRDSYPLFYYCTWKPFQTNINDKLIREIADNLQKTGTDVLIIDDGWQDNWGDYNSHPSRFPNGIEETCHYIKSKGIKPGMWFSIATINRSSKIYQQHPEWALKDSNGNSQNVYTLDTFRVTMSMSSPWYDYIKKTIVRYIKTCELGYVKLDFAVASSAYITNPEISGDYGTQDGIYGYKNQASSYWSLYNSSMRLFRDLKAEFPDLIVDCTFEVWGKYHIIDYALIQNADVDWLTNYEFDAPRGPISIRQIEAERSKVIPAQTMMVGNQLIDSPMKNFTYQSLASGVQLLNGDPRKLTEKEKVWYKTWSDWYKLMDKKYQYTRFTYRSDIFDQPSMINWDGCYRFNPEKQGGVLFFYRNGSLNTSIRFPIRMLNREATYHIYEPCGGKDYGVFKGSELLEKGIEISIKEMYEAKVLGIELTQNN
ncbi:MAG: glycoside hydrolase family 36 protein [Bacteroidales bacterium]